MNLHFISQILFTPTKVLTSFHQCSFSTLSGRLLRICITQSLDSCVEALDPVSLNDDL